MPLHLSQISIFIRKVRQRIHKVSHMRVIILLFLMAFASHSSSEEMGPCPDADSPTACAVEEAVNQALGAMPPFSAMAGRSSQGLPN